MTTSPHAALGRIDKAAGDLAPIMGTVAADTSLPVKKLNQEPVDPDVSEELIRQYLSVEGNATQNLATFVQTYMEPQATRLMAENLDKNAIDKDEYPMTADLENRCVDIIADLWNADPDEKPMGTSTVGSSEACMLGGLAALFRWKALAKAAGIDIYSATRPNLVVTSGYQVCWEKFCRYWDIELRAVPLTLDHLELDLDKVMDYVDDHTICVVAVLGITYTGRYDDVLGLDKLLSAYNENAKVPVRIHVDAASGGFVAPFIEPDLQWDFRLPNVWSISASGHKYGLVYPGVGWVLWRAEDALPADLVFWVSYLGGEEATMAINFSRSASQIVGQYYCFLRNGFNGYKAVHERTLDVARYIASELRQMGIFEIYEGARRIPIVCWGLRHDGGKPCVPWSLYDLSDRLRMHGWQVPSYPMPEALTDLTVQRVVCRADLSMPLAEALMEDIGQEVKHLNHASVLDAPAQHQKGFDHSGR